MSKREWAGVGKRERRRASSDCDTARPPPTHDERLTMRLLSRLPVLVLGGIAVVALTAGPALAHECFVANRSAQGNASVGAHSAAWSAVSLDTVLTQFIGVPQPVADCVVAHAGDFGLPTSFVFGGKQAVGQGGVIAENNPNFAAKGLSSNGQGIDHAEDVYGAAIGVHMGKVHVYPDGHRLCRADGHHGDWGITHWQPLPSPPSIEPQSPVAHGNAVSN